MSDQDFFFDEDEQQKAKEAPKPAAGSKTPASAPRAKSSSAAPSAVQTVTMTVAGLIGVVALLVGVIIGILIPTGGGDVNSPAGTFPTGAETGIQARPLTEQEMQGGMPEGHPDIDAMTGGEATDTAAPEGESE